MIEDLQVIEQEEIQKEIKTIENRGKPIVCKYCKHSFKIPEIELKKQWQNNNCICPKCTQEWCILPPTERKLKYLQETYLNNRCEKTVVPFIRLLDIYTQSLIKKNYKVYLNFEGSLEYYSYHAVTALIEEYLNREDFRIDISFGGYLIWKIKQAIFHPSELESKDTSLDYEFEDGNNLHELIPCDKNILEKIEMEEDTYKLYEKIIGLIEGVQTYCKDPYEDFIRTIAIHLYFKKGETAFDRLFQAFNRDGKHISMQTIDILRQELYKGSELVKKTEVPEIKKEVAPPIVNRMQLLNEEMNAKFKNQKIN